MKTDILYVSYYKDLPWLCYSLQLLFKHLKGDYRVYVRLEPDCADIVSEWGVPVTQYFYGKPWPDGYIFAMYQKLISDDYTDADCIALLDSDHLMLEPAHLDDFFEAGKPVIHYRNWNDDPNDGLLVVGKNIWGPPTEATMGIPLDRDYMWGPPFIFWRDTFSLTRARITRTTGKSVTDALYSDVPFHYKEFLDHKMTFCDYEALGLYAATYQADKYVVRHLRPSDRSPFKVYWSHEDWTPKLQAELDQILAS